MFEEAAWFGEAFALQGEGGLIFFEGAVDSGGADGQEFLPDGRGDAEGGPGGGEGHVLADEGSQELPAFMPEEGPDEAEGIDDLAGIDFFALPVGGSFFPRFEFDRFAFDDERGLRLVEEPQGVLPVFAAGNLDEFVQNGRLSLSVRL